MAVQLNKFIVGRYVFDSLPESFSADEPVKTQTLNTLDYEAEPLTLAYGPYDESQVWHRKVRRQVWTATFGQGSPAHRRLVNVLRNYATTGAEFFLQFDDEMSRCYGALIPADSLARVWYTPTRPALPYGFEPRWLPTFSYAGNLYVDGQKYTGEFSIVPETGRLTFPPGATVTHKSAVALKYTWRAKVRIVDLSLEEFDLSQEQYVGSVTFLELPLDGFGEQWYSIDPFDHGVAPGYLAEARLGTSVDFSCDLTTYKPFKDVGTFLSCGVLGPSSNAVVDPAVTPWVPNPIGVRTSLSLHAVSAPPGVVLGRISVGLGTEVMSDTSRNTFKLAPISVGVGLSQPYINDTTLLPKDISPAYIFAGVDSVTAQSGKVGDFRNVLAFVNLGIGVDARRTFSLKDVSPTGLGVGAQIVCKAVDRLRLNKLMRSKTFEFWTAYNYFLGGSERSWLDTDNAIFDNPQEAVLEAGFGYSEYLAFAGLRNLDIPLDTEIAAVRFDVVVRNRRAFTSQARDHSVRLLKSGVPTSLEKRQSVVYGLDHTTYSYTWNYSDLASIGGLTAPQLYDEYFGAGLSVLADPLGNSPASPPQYQESVRYATLTLWYYDAYTPTQTGETPNF